MVKLNREKLFAPVSVPCYNWTGLDGDSKRKTAIIAPVRIIEC